ncbi:emp24/gp25L/p24 family/GOLD-domain-containing protein [Chytriomyces sp. MP71]|nr:emp24/gp25L/p24 family/GOLD-domain-containing protein [Chytriomyces sp. MP71]
MRAPLLGLISLLLVSAANAVYFVLEGVEQKCFTEELPKDTTVLGKYSASVWKDDARTYVAEPLTIIISVESVKERHKILNQKGNAAGKFTFTTSDMGEHLICITVTGGPNQGWFSHSKTKIEFDVIFGDVAHSDTALGTKSEIEDITTRVRSLKYTVSNILNEQKYQRDREAEFRDFSESINVKVVRWTLVQIFFLLLTGYLQTRYLKQFLVSKKII